MNGKLLKTPKNSCSTICIFSKLQKKSTIRKPLKNIQVIIFFNKKCLYLLHFSKVPLNKGFCCLQLL